MEKVEEYSKGRRGKEKGLRLSGRGDRQGKGEQERNEVYLLKDTKVSTSVECIEGYEGLERDLRSKGKRETK